jgi:glycosyltransferase involved in cell wall biosynthesis
MPHVWAVYPETKLVIAGAKGSFFAQVSTLIQDLSPKQQSQITLMTDFSEAQKPALLAASDIFVLPSEAESFGIAFVEAWACRRPVIGARMGAVASLIDEEKDGLLFTCGDVGDLARAISTLLAAPQQRTQMGEAGFQKVLANYTWDIVVERTRSVYQSVIVHHNE